MPIAQVSSTTLEALTLPELIDYHLEHNPDYTFTVFPGESIDDEVSRVSYLEFGRATQRFARAVRPDAPVKRGEAVGIIVNCDSLMYITAIAGLARAGLTAFPMSARNSAAAICHMLKKVSSHRLIVTASSLGSLLGDVKKELAASDYAIDVQELPAFPDVYPHFTRESASDLFEPIELPSRDAFVDGVVLYIHSSGSTGFPKPIPWTHKVLSKYTNEPYVDEYRGIEKDILMASPGMPSFHTMGVVFQLIHPLYTGRPAAMFTPTYPRPPTITTPQTVLEALKALKPNYAFVVPSLLEVWVHDRDAIEFLKSLDMIGFGGGPLSSSVGDRLVAEGCKLGSMYGGTEFGVPGRMISSHKSPEDWAWMEVYPTMTPRWIPQDDGSFELQLLTTEKHELAVENLPDVRGYSTKDVFVPHPTKEGWWKIVGRADDVLILANGEKIVPGPTEGTLLAHPYVRGAVMFGRERNQAGLLIEPDEHHEIDPNDEAALAAYRNEIWPAVEEANRSAPAFGRIFKEMILVASPNKPLPRAAKGTVNHKAATALYDEEIRALYDAVESPEKGSGVPPPDTWEFHDVYQWLLALAKSIQDGREVTGDVDLFEQGFDSLSATFLRNNITAALRTSGESSGTQSAATVGNNFVYANPILNEMARAIISLVNPDERVEDADPTVVIKKMIDSYSWDMPTMNTENKNKPDGEVVLLTGSTGGLGSYLLASLITDERVKKIYALNRPSAKKTSLARHETTFEERALDASLLGSPKLVFVEGEASRNLLGLSASQYEEVRTSVTIIIHNAWRLDFNLSLSSFEPNIRGTRNLLDLALTSPHAVQVRMLFTSSIAVSQSWPHGGELFPEEPQDNARWCVGNGYGEGKYVGEQLLVRAAEHGLQTTSFRIGQISGGNANGAWATTDWVPIMIASSIALGGLPDAEGVSSWLPFDAVSQAIIDVAFGKEAPERALNLVHPRPLSWYKIMEAVSNNLVESGITKDHLPLINLEEWLSRLEEASVGANDETLKRIPAIKLLDFFRSVAQADVAVRAAEQEHAEAGGLSSLSTTKSQQASQALRELRPLDAGDVGRWIGYWKSKGLFARTEEEIDV